jgi:hypothetical protein
MRTYGKTPSYYNTWTIYVPTFPPESLSCGWRSLSAPLVSFLARGARIVAFVLPLVPCLTRRAGVLALPSPLAPFPARLHFTRSHVRTRRLVCGWGLTRFGLYSGESQAKKPHGGQKAQPDVHGRGSWQRRHESKSIQEFLPRGNMKAARSVNHRGLPGGTTRNNPRYHIIKHRQAQEPYGGQKARPDVHRGASGRRRHEIIHVLML